MRRGRSASVVLAAGGALVLGGCGPFGGAGAPEVAAPERSETRGGTLSALSLGPVLSWDPQRIGSRDDMAFAGRVFARTLTAYTPGTTVVQQSRLVGDLATGTGTADRTLQVWRFTLRGDVTWEDGSPVTCADVRYGISRTFATDVVTGGSTDALAVLDIPKNPDGTSVYRGPYVVGAPAGQKAFERAVSCSGSTITFRLAAPTSDFNEMLTQSAFAPVKREKDRGRLGTYSVFSNGPYRLEGKWASTRGGTFVRNPSWRPQSDPVRKAYPDTIRYEEGLEAQTIAQRIMADQPNGRTAVALGSAPPALQLQIQAVRALIARSVNPGSGVVDYLVPNLKRGPLSNVRVRRALAAATNRRAYAVALGGPTASRPVFSLLPPSAPAAHHGDPVGAGLDGSLEAARAALAGSGVSTPVRVTVAYRQSPAADKAMAGLAAGWRRAGFDPVLVGLGQGYFDEVSAKRAVEKYDLFWSNWSPTWASGSTVLPPLFDSGLNLTASGPGRDYGWFTDTQVNADMAKVPAIVDRTERERAWAALDRRLLRDSVYIGLVERRNLFVSGSQVRNLTGNEVLGGVVDLADIAVAT